MQHKVLEAIDARPIAAKSRSSCSAQITVVVPVRIDEANAHLLSRLDWSLRDPTAPQHVRVLVVDDGSPKEFSDQISGICVRNGFQCERLDTRNRIFSIGRARNHAAKIASTKYIFFMDADLLPPTGFFAKLSEEIAVQNIDEHAEDFLMIPVSYLTPEATEDYLLNNGDQRYAEFLDHTIRRTPEIVEKFSPGTSACLYNRLYFLARGGNYDDFSGWGYEDIEFNLRMARLTGIFPIPANYNRDQYSFDKQFLYQGWKAIYRLFGDRSFLKGLMLFHAWHPVDKSTDYYREREKNKIKFDKLIARFVDQGTEPAPIPDPRHGRSLLLKQSPFTYSRELRPMLGEVVSATSDSLPSDANLAEMLASRQITRIVFQNPYATIEDRRIYDWARRSGFPILVCERGALPGSILFDRTGFLADSSLFDQSNWDQDLSPEHEAELQAYIREETASSASLEAQASARFGPVELREKLGVTSLDKLVLVLLQRPDDTATKYFDGPLGAYGDFLWQIEKISGDLPPNVRLAFKIHPLEDCAPPIKGIDASDYHLNDLLAIADKIVTFTSGTGVVAMLWNLPVIACGRAFYSQPGLTYTARSAEELRDLMCSHLSVDEIAYRKFLHYLRFRYYSIGVFVTRPVRLPTGARMTATTGIRFQTIRGFGNEDLKFACRARPEDSWQSMLFDRYVGAKGNDTHSRNTTSKPWGAGRKIVHRIAIESIGRLQDYESRQKLRQNPIDFFKKAKWPPNRFFGRLLLDKSQRPY